VRTLTHSPRRTTAVRTYARCEADTATGPSLTMARGNEYPTCPACLAALAAGWKRTAKAIRTARQAVRP
jgi:hypothetical protein